MIRGAINKRLTKTKRNKDKKNKLQETQNLRVRVLLLYSSLVLRSGLISLINRASRVRSLKYLFALARMLTESSEILADGSQVSICLLIVPLHPKCFS